MLKDVRIMKALADENRLRLVLLLKRKELFVCQLMAVTGLSQPLVSRSLALLEREGLLDSRRQGKHVFYRLKKILPPLGRAVIAAFPRTQDAGARFVQDRANLELFCRRFQSGKACDMSTVKQFIAFKNKNQ
jgi:DNA-binding transcriptional ArsR family regulator